MKVTDAQLQAEGLKRAKFSDLVDGQEFNVVSDFYPSRSRPVAFYRRKIKGDIIVFADGSVMFTPEYVRKTSPDKEVFIEEDSP